MTRRPDIFFALPLLFLLPVPVVAQDHSAHGAPGAMRAGTVRFPTSCSAAAQPAFLRGVTYLHSFWYEQAGTSFREAIAADSNCTMAQWGLATSYLHPLWAPPNATEIQAASAAIAAARRLNPTDARERGYVEAIGAYYDNHATTPHGQRLRAWEQALGRLHAANPTDDEAATFHALSLIAIQPKTDTAYAQLRQAADILEPLFARQPEHPGLSHYLIHAYDAPPLVGRSVRAAGRYATIAPSVPHAQHMPSHTYSLLGMWDQSVAANRRSADASRRFETEQRMEGVWDQRLHAMDYMAYAWLQQGRYALAQGLVREAASIERVVPPGSVAAEFALAAIPVRYALEREDWQAAAALLPRPSAVLPIVRAATAFGRALGAARRGDTTAARADISLLAELEAAAARGPDPFGPPMIQVNRLAASSWLMLAAGDTAGAIRTATEAAVAEEGALKNPMTPGPLLSARELLADMYLEVGRPADAVTAYRAALVNTPRRLRSLAGGVKAADQAGNRALATQWRRELRTLTANADRQ